MAFKMQGITFHDLTRDEELSGVSHLKHKVGNPPVYHKGPDWNIYPDQHTHDAKTGDEIKHFYKGKKQGKLYTYEEKKKEEEESTKNGE